MFVWHAQRIVPPALVRSSVLTAHPRPIFTTKTVYPHAQLVITVRLLLECVWPVQQPYIAPPARVQSLALVVSILTSTIKMFASLHALQQSQCKTQLPILAILAPLTVLNVADIPLPSALNVMRAISLIKIDVP